MKDVAATIQRERSLSSVKDRIASVAEVFRLQGEPELAAAEAKYLPKS